MERCHLLLNATASNFTAIVTPEAYKANTTYLVTISDNRNLTDSKNVTEYLLQALSPQNVSMGEWKVVDSCIDTAILNATQKAAHWTPPDSNISSMEIRPYIIFTDKSTKFKTVTQQRKEELGLHPQSLLNTTQHFSGLGVIILLFTFMCTKAGSLGSYSSSPGISFDPLIAVLDPTIT